MAISLGFGIMFATLIILVLIPAFFMVLKDFTKKRDRRTLPLE
jgi:multidrug efflux pump subunit AcrB